MAEPVRAFRPRPPEPLPTPVPYDPELVPGLAVFLNLVERIPLRADTIDANRAHFRTITPPLAEQLAGRDVVCEERIVPGPEDAPDVEVTIIRPAGVRDDGGPEDALRPAVLGIHGGGYVLGTRSFGTGELIDLAERTGAIGVAVEYRLAPETRAPGAAEDCYAALVWMARHAEELRIDPERIVVTGSSAGGGLAAAVALMARDRGEVRLAGQLLGSPMIDDRNGTVSAWQYDGIGAWDRNNNDTGWDAALGEDRGGDGVGAYQAPARAVRLSGLAPAFLEVGSAEIFRDETIAYAEGIWAAGGEAELHVWSGGYHGFTGFSPDAEVSRAANAARDSWWRRILAR
ncbi:alpha/beta hydrolase [Leucobacter allii]|uniref:alpha/beta hydrolase n=1 Tax=Leucobacter allii TaxID=2932247 RepID=UPI001FD3CCB6|nr:alpha/beta hydrolase fold domain-containing protein [Leucobacter allii]UOR00510.1 alpha/beta hydrolase [Leucobacter allii]